MFTCKERHDVCRVLDNVSLVFGNELAEPSAVVSGQHVVDDDAAVGVGEPEVGQPPVLVGPARSEAVGGAVGRGPQALVEGLVGMAHQGRVGVGVLHQRRRS